MADLQKILIEQADFALKSLQDMQEKAQQLRDEPGFQEFWLPFSGLEVIPEDIVVELLYGRIINKIADGNFHDSFLDINTLLHPYGANVYRYGSPFDGFDKWDALGIGEDIFNSFVDIGMQLSRGWIYASAIDNFERVLHLDNLPQGLIDMYKYPDPNWAIDGEQIGYPANSFGFAEKYGNVSDIMPFILIYKSLPDDFCGIRSESLGAIVHLMSRIPVEYRRNQGKTTKNGSDYQLITDCGLSNLAYHTYLSLALESGNKGLSPLSNVGYTGDPFRPRKIKRILKRNINEQVRTDNLEIKYINDEAIVSNFVKLSPQEFPLTYDLTRRGRHALNQMIDAVYELRVAYCPGSPVPYQVCHASATPEEVSELNKLAQLHSPVDSLESIGNHLYKN